MESEQPTSAAYEPKRRWFEPLAATLMAVSTLGTAWCSYQSSQWSGLDNEYSTQADTLQRQAVALHLEGNQVQSVHIQLVMQTVDAKLSGNEKIASFYVSRFPPDLRKAYDAWLLQKPFENPHADSSPFKSTLYQQPFSAERRQAMAESQRFGTEAKKAGKFAEKYLSNTLLLAMVLFFAGTAGEFDKRYVRQSTLLFGVAVFLYAAARMLVLPVAGGVIVQ